MENEFPVSSRLVSQQGIEGSTELVFKKRGTGTCNDQFRGTFTSRVRRSGGRGNDEAERWKLTARDREGGV